MTTVSGDVYLREREDHLGVPQLQPEAEQYADWVGTAPVVIIPPPSVTTKDGFVIVEDKRQAPHLVETDDDGGVTVKIPT